MFDLEFHGDDQIACAVERPVLRRLRHRRLIAYLWLQGLDGTVESMAHETDVFFSVAHLQGFIRQGRWRDAIAYLARFLQLDNDDVLSVEAQVLFAHYNLAEILADTKEGHVVAEYFRKYRRHDSTVCNGTLRLRSIMLTALHAKEHLRVSFDWERVRYRAAKIACNLVHRTPELKGVAALPPGSLKPHTVLPIHPSVGQRYRRKKHPFQPRASALAKCYLRKRGSLLSSKESDNELHAKANWVADILDESLQAGRPLELHQKLKDTTVASGSKATFGSLAGPAENLGPISL